MSKIKKCLLIIVISIIGLIVFQGESKGAGIADLLSSGQIGVTGNIGIGGTINVNPKQNMLSPDSSFGAARVYCVQYHTKLPDKDIPFEVKKYLEIEGNYGTWYVAGSNEFNGTIHHVGSENNNFVFAKVAYILQTGKTTYPSNYGYGTNWGEYSDTQIALYNVVQALDSEFMKDVPTPPMTDGARQLLEGSDTLEGADTYARSFPTDKSYEDVKSSINSTGAYIENKTNKDDIEVSLCQESGTTYIRVGPFNWEFNGKIKDISVESDKGVISDVKYSKYVGDNEVSIDKTEIKSSEKFYIKIKASTNHTMIKSIKPTVETESTGYIKAELWLLSHGTYQNLMVAQSEDLRKGPDSTTVTFDDEIRLTKELKILKIDSAGEEYPLSGVGFVLKNLEMNKYVRVQNGEVSYIELSAENENDLIGFLNNKTVKNSKKPTEFVTNNKGKITVENLLIGTYAVFETLNPNYGYVLDEQETTIIPPDYYEQMVITNHQRYVKLSGFIWEDITSTLKPTVRNNLYKTDIKKEEYDDDRDVAAKDIIVRLKNSSGETVTKKDGTKQECVSAERDLYSEIEGGEYIFEEVEREELSNYYVEFEYDGLIYQSVPLLTSKNLKDKDILNDYNFSKLSKATDVRERDILDKNFTRVDATGENRVDVNNGTYYITYNDTVNHATSIKDSNCIVHARTDGNQPDDANLDIGKLFKPTMEEIRYINLGLYKKPQADLALDQELHKVTVGVNGYQHVYRYKTGNLSNEQSDSWNVGVKFKNTNTGSYKRAIYQADYEYENDDKNKNLQVILTYEIAIKNSKSYLTKANSIVYYFDNRYTLEAIGTSMDEEGKNIVMGTYEKPTIDTYDQQYNKFNIDINSEVKSNTTNSIYVQFRLNKEAIVEIMNSSENKDKLLYTRAEITSYTVYKDKNKTVAAVDENSVPGNTNIYDVNTYEDDTDSAPPILLKLDGARSIQGSVFEDTPIGELGVGKTRNGNGIYDKDDVGIGNVEVKMESTQPSSDNKTYRTTTVEKDGWYIIRTNKNENDTNVIDIIPEQSAEGVEGAVELKKGDYYIKEFIPDKYKITFTWGDRKYTVQNYKATIYNEPDRQYNISVNETPWYKTIDPRYSDAFDDWITRVKIDEQMASITDNTITNQVKAYEENYSGDIIHSMDSTTPIMEFSVEYDTNETDGTDNKVEFIVKNVDFGIAERAKQQLDMTKRVSSFKITLANGQILVNATVDKNGDLQDSHDYVTYMKPDLNKEPPFSGYIRAEMDNELIEGATLEVGYEIKFINNSEVDYMTEKYYEYGTYEKGDPVVTLTPSAVIDYLDKDLSFDKNKNVDDDGNPIWEQLTIEELEDKDIYEKNLLVLKNNEDILDTRTILYTEGTVKEIKPGEDSSVKLNVSKLLTTSDDLTFDNDAETVKIDKPSEGDVPRGRVVPYFPEDSAPPVIITPSTGDDRAYVVPTIVGITSLLILSIGVFVIKKVVIDNK